MDKSLQAFIEGMPKIELHLHLEGTMEPEMLWDKAQRNGVVLLDRDGQPFNNVGEVKQAYTSFDGLKDFIPLYLQGMKVLRTEEDFYDLTYAYLKKVSDQNVTHTEVFFDPQGHTSRGVPFETVINGITRALKDAEKPKGEGKGLGVSSKLIMSFLRDLSEEDAFKTLEQGKPYIEQGLIQGIGLDNPERGNPPSKFERVYARARELFPDLIFTAHAGEEGPADYVRQALDSLKVNRIDHGDNSLDDPELVARLVKEKKGLTVCPVCKVKLKGIDSMTDHKLKKMLELGIKATVNSDDPGYFQAYINENFVAVADALHLTRDHIIQLARNAIEISALSSEEKLRKTKELDEYIAKTPVNPINVDYADGLIEGVRGTFRAMIAKNPALFDSATNPRIENTLGTDIKRAPMGTIDVPAGIDISTTAGLMGGVDLTLLDLSAQNDKVAAIAQRAKEEGCATVCVYPKHVKIVQNITGGNPPPIAVVGFPAVDEPSAAVTATTVEQTRQAIADGAREIDMVLPMNFKDSPIKSESDYAAHYNYIRSVVEEANKTHTPVKVILETAYLTDPQKVEASLIAKLAGARFVKTSTGFARDEWMQNKTKGAPKGATTHDVALMRRTVGDTTVNDAGETVAMGVKASGGVRNRQDAVDMYRAGADRIGASGGLNVRTVEEQAEYDRLHPPVKAVGGGY